MQAEAAAPIGHNAPPPLRDILAENHASLLREVEALADRANAAPRQINDDADFDTVGTLAKDAGALVRRVDGFRKTEKEPYLQAGREVDGFFGAMTDRLDRIKAAFQKIADDHMRAKAAEERRRREEEARKAREEEERQREIARRAEEANRAKTAEKHDAKADALAEKAAIAEASAQASAADLTRTRTASGTLATARTEWAFEITDVDAIPLDKLRPYLPRAEIEKAIRAYVRFHKDAAPLAGVRIFEDVRASFR